MDWQHRIQPLLESVRERIAEAAARSDRSSGAIKLVAISKGQPLVAIEAAVELGLSDIGENRVEEALKKQAALSHLPINWHMVGHIQSRKAKQIPGHFAWVHSVDRVKIARRLSYVAEEQGTRLPILLECNVSGETSKEGWNLNDPSRWVEVLPEFAEILDLPGLDVRGLMTMAPWVQDEGILRSTFQMLRVLRDYLRDQFECEFPELSMGMTDDYKYAVEEGASIVRIGRAIFGSRTT